MTKQKRFTKRNKVLTGLAIATVTSTTVPLVVAEEVSDVSLESTKVQLSPSIKSIQSKAGKNYIQIWGSDFNAGKNANNGKPKEKPKPIVIKPRS